MKTERDLQNYIKRECRKGKIGYYKLNCEGQTGWPDLMLIKNGHSIHLEVKTPAGTGRLSPRQILMIDRMRNQGAEVYVVDSESKAQFIVSDLTQRPPTESYFASL